MKHRQDSSNRTGSTTRRRWHVPALLLTSALIGTSLTAGIVATQAEAAAPPRNVYLGGLGLFTDGCPVTPSNVVYAQPGSTVRLRPNTAGFGSLSVASLSAKVTNPTTGAPVAIKTSVAATPPAGTYLDVGVGSSQRTLNFTWQFTLQTIYVLGIPLPLGEVLSKVGADPGVKLKYAGQIVVSTRAQSCTLAPQLPGVEVSPSLPVVGNLPGVNVPGVQLPGVQVPGTTANPTTGSSSTAPGSTAPGGTAATPGSTSTTTATNPYDYTAPGCTGPCAVVPKGGGGGGSVGNAYDVTLGDISDPAAASGSDRSGSAASGDASAAGADGAVQLGSGSDQIAVDRAFGETRGGGDSAPGLPTTLTIIAIAALAGTSVLWFARRRLARG